MSVSSLSFVYCFDTGGWVSATDSSLWENLLELLS